jgi:hypothetical protein
MGPVLGDNDDERLLDFRKVRSNVDLIWTDTCYCILELLGRQRHMSTSYLVTYSNPG